MLEQRLLLSGTTALVADVLTVPSTEGSDIADEWTVDGLTPVGNTTFFTATSPEAGHELWKTDGTASGTVLVKDIFPGITPQLPYDTRPSEGNGWPTVYPYFNHLTNVAGTLFFISDDGAAGLELWKSDGSESGTVLVKELPTLVGKYDFAPPLAAHSGKVFFAVDDNVNGTELWVSDGTSSGTHLLKDINPGGSSSFPSEFHSHNGLLYFAANDGTHGRELWSTDGTQAGTVLVHDVIPGSTGSSPEHLVSVNGALLFDAGWLHATDGTPGGLTQLGTVSISGDQTAMIGSTLLFPGYSSGSGTELWKTDGTAAGTTQVAEIYPGAGGSRVEELTSVGGIAFFRARVDPLDHQLWKSDGTTAGTMLVRDMTGGTDSPAGLTNVNGELFFAVNGLDDDLGYVGRELWKSDGTEAGTVLVKDIHSGTSDANPESLRNRNGTLLFVADDGIHGEELWVSDGTIAGTQMLKDVNAGTASGWPGQLHEVNGSLVFAARTGGEHPSEDVPYQGLFAVDSGGTLQTLHTFGNEGHELSLLTTIGSQLFFTVDDPSTGSELWTTDGTAGGTGVVKDIIPSQDEGFIFRGPQEVIDVGGTLFFSIRPKDTGRELWKSDGTAAGTLPVADIFPGYFGSTPKYLTNVSGTLFFTAESDPVDPQQSPDRELWKSDGTEAGTTLVKDIRPPGSSLPFLLTNVNGSLFFTADDDTHGRELWTSDGTEIGTVLVKDLALGTADGIPAHLTAAGNQLFFTAFDGGSQRHLYRTDGTSQGTIQLMTNAGEPDELLAIGNDLFLVISDGTGAKELWVSDGTVSGTTQLLSGLDDASDLTAFAGQLWLSVDDGVNGAELWRSDGTPAGTTLAKDLNPGAGDGAPGDFREIAGFLYFNANDGVTGPRVWRTDGTPSGTQSFSAGPGEPAAVDPAEFTAVGDSIYFAASTSAYGRELFRLDPPATDPPSSAPVITGPAAVTADLRPAITWQAVQDAAEYEIWIKNQSTNTNPFHQATVSGTTYTPDIDLGIGRFNLWIRAKNAAGNGPWTSQYNFRINTRASVDDPGRFLNTHRPTLNWPELAGAVRYDLWIDDKLGGVSQFIRDQNITDTTWTPSADMPLGLYHAWIRGIAADGSSGGWSVTTIFYVMPSPTVTAGMNPTFDRAPTFAWDPLLGAVTYEVFVRNRITGGTALYEQNIADLNFTPSENLADGPYRVWIIGVSGVNVRSYWTDPMDVYIGGRTDVLSPSGSTSDTTPQFAWRTVDGAARYDLWVDEIGGQGQIIREQNLTSTSFTPSTALPTSDFRVWVRAISTTGEVSSWSLTVQFTIASAPAADADGGELPESHRHRLVGLSEDRVEASAVDAAARVAPGRPSAEVDPARAAFAATDGLRAASVRDAFRVERDSRRMTETKTMNDNSVAALDSVFEWLAEAHAPVPFDSPVD